MMLRFDVLLPRARDAVGVAIRLCFTSLRFISAPSAFSAVIPSHGTVVTLTISLHP